MRSKEVQEYIENLARKGGEGRAAKLTPAKRRKIAKKAARTRWSKKSNQK